MRYTVRSSFTGLAILTISVSIFSAVFHQQSSFERSAARKQWIELRTGTGAPLATIFVGSLGYGLDQQTVKGLLAERVTRSRNLCSKTDSHFLPPC